MKKKFIFIILFIFQMLLVKAQSSDASICNSINNLNEKLNCVMHIYENTEKNLNKSYSKLIQSLQNKIESGSLKYQSKNLSILNLLKSHQTDWVLSKNYNAEVHYFLSIGKLESQIAFYKSKIKDNKNQSHFFDNFLLILSKLPN